MTHCKLFFKKLLESYSHDLKCAKLLISIWLGLVFIHGYHDLGMAPGTSMLCSIWLVLIPNFCLIIAQLECHIDMTLRLSNFEF